MKKIAKHLNDKSTPIFLCSGAGRVGLDAILNCTLKQYIKKSHANITIHIVLYNTQFNNSVFGLIGIPLIFTSKNF